MKIFPEKLAPRQRALGQRRYLWFARLNGVSISCLADNVLILYALTVGLPESLVGVLASCVHISMPFMLLGKGLVKRFGAARSIGLMWMARNSCGVFIALVPFLAVGRPTLIPYLIVSGSLAFFCFRAAGMVGMNPLIADISDDLNRGGVAARNFIQFNAAYLASMLALIWVMRLGDGDVRIFQAIIAFGAGVGFISSLIVMRVPETASLQRSAAEPVRRAMLEVWRHSGLRRLIFAQTAVAALVTAIPPLSMAALKKGYQVSDADALFFALLALAGGLIAALASRTVSERSGPHPLLLLGGGSLLGVTLLWVVAPPTMQIPHVALIFLMAGFGAGMTGVALMHCFIVATPEKLRLPGGLMMSLGSGLGAVAAGFGFASGGLALLQRYGFSGLSLYRAYFMLAAPLALPALWLLSRVEKVSDWRLRHLVGLFFSPRDLRAALTLSRMEEISTPLSDRQTVDALANSKSHLSEQTLLQFLKSPDFSVRAQTLNALRQLDALGPAAREALIAELRENRYTTAYLAAEIVGERGVEEAVPALLEALACDDVYLVGKSMVALSRLGVRDANPKTADILRRTDNPRLAIHGAAALVETGLMDYLEPIVLKATDDRLPGTVQAELLYHAGRLTQCGDDVYQFISKWDGNPELGELMLRERLQECGLAYDVAWRDVDVLRRFLERHAARRLPTDETARRIVHLLATAASPLPDARFIGCLWLLASLGVPNERAF